MREHRAYSLLADLVLIAHMAVVFVVGGLLLIIVVQAWLG